MNSNIVSIKGTPNGLIFYFDTDEASFSQICAALEEKLQKSGDFFTNAEYLIDRESRFTLEELAIIEGIMSKYRIRRGKLAPHLLDHDEQSELVYETIVGDSMLITKSIRSGQKISIRGNAVIMGDINPGGEIVATGNVVVMGCCRGVLHAGAEGDETSYIIAYDMQAQQLRIADHVATLPNSTSLSPLKLAVVQNGDIVITDYIPAQFQDILVSEEE